MTYIDNMSFSNIRIRIKPKGIESRLLSRTIENSFNVPETVFCFARSITFLSRNCSFKQVSIALVATPLCCRQPDLETRQRSKDQVETWRSPSLLTMLLLSSAYVSERSIVTWTLGQIKPFHFVINKITKTKDMEAYRVRSSTETIQYLPWIPDSMER